MASSGQGARRLALFAVALAAAAGSTWCDAAELHQDLIWLPTGVAVTGLALCGWRAAWLVFAVGLLQRHLGGSLLHVSLLGATGATVEALVGATLIQLFHVRRGCDRLRDVVGIYVASLVTPLASILIAVGSRMLFWNGSLDVWTGMVGWWCMNALGILVIAPFGMARPTLRDARTGLRPLMHASLWALAAAAAAAGVLLFEPGVPSLILFGALPLMSFLAALQLGNRGASAVALVGVLLIALPASYGIGPLHGVDVTERHVVAQMVLLGLATLSPLFGALLAERDADAARWLQSEGVGRALLRLLPDPSYRLAPDGTVIDAMVPQTDGAAPVSEVLGRHITDFAPPGCHAQLREQMAELQRGGKTDPVEYTHATSTGRRDTELRLVRLPNDQVLSLTRDITERKRAERQLTLQAEILELIAGGAPLQDVLDRLTEGLETLLPNGRSTIMLLQDDRLMVASAPSLPREYTDMIDGLPIGQNCGACGTAAHAGATVVCADTLTDPRTSAFREAIERFDLRACWSVPIRSTDDSMLGTIAIYHAQVHTPPSWEVALTERAAMLARLAIDRDRRESLLSSIQQNVNEGVFRCIPGKGFVYTNGAFANMLGYESASSYVSNGIRPSIKGTAECLEQLSNESTSFRSRKINMLRKDGGEFLALVTTSVTNADSSESKTCDGTLTDISSLKELEDQLRQAQKMEAVGQLAGGVAHDFNNLLTVIMGFADAIKSELPPGSGLHDDAYQILEASRRAAALTRQLLAFGRQQVLQPEVLAVHQVVAEMREMMGRLIGEHINLKIEPPTQPVRAKVDRGQLEQVILNLVLNSRDAMPKGGTITITTEVVGQREHDHQAGLEPGRYARMRVRDTGHGMPPEVIARAFEPFYTTKAQGRGTGLGLSTVYGILKQSGGTAVIESVPAKGACVSVYLPCTDDAPEDLPDAVLPRRQLRHGTILVVEDEPFVLDLAGRALQSAGHEVLRASDGREALQVFDEHKQRVDMVVTDLVMPNMGGQALATELRKRQPALRILFMSGYAFDTFADEPVAAETFLHKPFTTSQLTERVGIMLADRHPRHESDPGARSET